MINEEADSAAILRLLEKAAAGSPRAQTAEAALVLLQATREIPVCENEALFRLYAAGLLFAFSQEGSTEALPSEACIAARQVLRREAEKVRGFDPEVAHNFLISAHSLISPPGPRAIRSALFKMQNYLERAKVTPLQEGLKSGTSSARLAASPNC